MTTELSFIQRVITKLEVVGIEYMVAGSVGSAFYGESRSTNDVDIVIAATPGQIAALLQSLDVDWYASSIAAEQALRNRSMFNVLETKTGSKADLVILKDRAFSREEFRRRQLAKVEGVSLWVARPEDIILSKLEWSQMGDSDRQYRDAVNVAKIQWGTLDVPYLRHWAVDLNVVGLLEKALAAAEKQQTPTDPIQ